MATPSSKKSSEDALYPGALTRVRCFRIGQLGEHAVAQRSRYCSCFLSCLCGSELPAGEGALQRGFLSCLCGSERIGYSYGWEEVFLSCLCGSELNFVCEGFERIFLSCLCGSER